MKGHGMLSDYPHSAQWSDLLLWCVQVMDIEDPDLSFTAGMLAQAIDMTGMPRDKSGKVVVQ